MSIFQDINRRLGEGSTWGGATAFSVGLSNALNELGAGGAANKAAMAAEAATQAGTLIFSGMHPFVAIGMTVLGAFGILSPTSRGGK